MESTRGSLQSGRAFTIVEMIAVIAIIAILVGLLIPALSTVQKMAAKVKQKSQMTTISIGLETFREDMGDYPDSSNTVGDYQGAQKLAEAMIGLDGFGFHPDSVFRSDRMDVTGTIPLYKPEIDTYIPPVGSPWTIENNLASRKGPYIELDTANAVKLGDIYATPAPLNADTFVLADQYKTVKHLTTGSKTGMPILYFKANTLKTNHSIGFRFTSTYNYGDNRAFVDLPAPFDGSVHPMSITPEVFYIDTANPNFTAPPRPYNNETFILLSAGPDGNYGTSDDVYNFERPQ